VGLSWEQIVRDHPEITRVVTPKLTKYIPHKPTPKQTAFLLLDKFQEAFYGGAAGGGKSDALLMAALQYVDVSGYAALLLRKTYSDLALPEALMDRASSWLRGTDAHWDDTERTWRFPSGATLTFGYLEHEADRFRYQSAAFQFIGFDELTQFSETQYLYLFSRLRRLSSADIPLRMRGASNPGNIGHLWVKTRFIDPETREDRIFVPASLSDNPYLDTTEYTQSLMKLDPVTRQQLLRGDWSARVEGGAFKREWFKIVSGVPDDLTVCRYWDPAATEPKPGTDPDWTAGSLIGRSKRKEPGVWFFLDMKRFRGTSMIVENTIKAIANTDPRGAIIGIEQEPGASGKQMVDHYRRQVLVGYNVRTCSAGGDRSKIARGSIVSSAAEAGNFRLLRGRWIPDWFEECEVWPYGAHDDQVDSVSGAVELLTTKHGGVGIMR